MIPQWHGQAETLHGNRNNSSYSVSEVSSKMKSNNSHTCTMFYFVAHRALADVEAMRDVFFCTQLKDLNDKHEQFLCHPLEQKNKYKSMVKIRERTKMLLLKFGSAISGTMAKKIATEGFDFNQLKNLRATFPDKEKFSQFLRSKGLSLPCSKKLAAYFFQP